MTIELNDGANVFLIAFLATLGVGVGLIVFEVLYEVFDLVWDRTAKAKGKQQ